MMKKLVLGSVLMATCLYAVNVEASYTEMIRNLYANNDVYAEYEIYVAREGIKKYSYGRVANNMYLKYDSIASTSLKVNADEPIDNSYVTNSKELKRDVNRMNNIFKALNSSNGSYRKAYDLNIIKEDKIYFINTTLKEGEWGNIGDFEQSKALFFKALQDTPDGIYYMNVMRDVVTSSKDRVSVSVVNSSKEKINSDLYDCEEVIVQKLSWFGKPVGDKMTCKLYFKNGCLFYFSPLKYVIGDSPYSKQKNYSIEYKYGDEIFKVLQLTNNVKMKNFDLINICKLERFPLGW